jgi:SAM-dependent methyltransferase
VKRLEYNHNELQRRREFPDWEKMYVEQAVETMPWFHPELDADLESALDRFSIDSGSFLDLGTGPGTQAIALAERGFRVTGTDISKTAVRKAAALTAERGLDLVFKADDILKTGLNKKFDNILDRGCFHVLDPDKRGDYVKIAAGLLEPGGYLFLKTFSVEELMEGGPYRFTPDDIRGLFSRRFEVVSIEESVFRGTLAEFPKALFCVLRKK